MTARSAKMDPATAVYTLQKVDNCPDGSVQRAFLEAYRLSHELCGLQQVDQRMDVWMDVWADGWLTGQMSGYQGRRLGDRGDGVVIC